MVLTGAAPSIELTSRALRKIFLPPSLFCSSFNFVCFDKLGQRQEKYRLIMSSLKHTKKPTFKQSLKAVSPSDLSLAQKEAIEELIELDDAEFENFFQKNGEEIEHLRKSSPHLLEVDIAEFYIKWKRNREHQREKKEAMETLVERISRQYMSF